MAGDLIRMMAMKMAHGLTCNKCGESRQKGNHQKCDRWPTAYGSSKGFHYVANCKETTLEELKKMVDLICAGEAIETPIRFELKIMQTRNI